MQIERVLRDKDFFCIFSTHPPMESLPVNLAMAIGTYLLEVFTCDYHEALHTHTWCRRSFEVFVDAVDSIRKGQATVDTYIHSLASIAFTYRTTAILEAGRRSLDSKKTIRICYDDINHPCLPTTIAESS